MKEYRDLMSRGDALPGDQLTAAAHSRLERALTYPVAAAAMAIGVVAGGGIPSPRTEASTVVEFAYDDTDPGPLPKQRQPWVPTPNEQYRHHGNAVLKIGR